MITMIGPISTAVAVGADGAAAGTKVTDQIVTGAILGVDIQYNDAPPAGTTDFGLKTKGASGILPSRNILTITNAATSGYFAPRSGCVTSANAAITDANAPFVVNDYLQLDMAGANAGDSVTIWVYLER